MYLTYLSIRLNVNKSSALISGLLSVATNFHYSNKGGNKNYWSDSSKNWTCLTPALATIAWFSLISLSI